MDAFKPITLDQHGRHTGLADEIELFVADKVAIYCGDESRPRYEGGVARLTSHRIIWSCFKFGFALDLEGVQRFEVKSGFLASSPKIILYMSEKVVMTKEEVSWKCPACDEINEDNPLKCFLCGTINPVQKVSLPSPAASTKVIKLSFRSSGHSKFVEYLGKALSKSAWNEEERRIKAAAASQFDPLVAGVAGLMKRAEEGRSKQLTTQTEAFADLDALMNKAGEMAKLAEAISKKLSATTCQDGLSDAQDREFQALLLDLGLTGTASSRKEGSAYILELSRQLSVFLCKLFELRQVQMMSLSDIYCIYNRARGNDLVSPQDLFRAASHFESLSLPVKLRAMSSGLLVVQSSAFSDEQVVNRLMEAFTQVTCITPFDLATRDGISTQLASELLMACERGGQVCRDLAPSGIQFYPNLFIKGD